MKRKITFVAMLIVSSATVFYSNQIIGSTKQSPFATDIVNLQFATTAFQNALNPITAYGQTSAGAFAALINTLNSSYRSSNSWTPDTTFINTQNLFYAAIMNLLANNPTLPTTIKTTQAQILSRALTLAAVNLYLSANTTTNANIPTPYGQDPAQYFFEILVSFGQLPVVNTSQTTPFSTPCPTPFYASYTTPAPFNQSMINPIEMTVILNQQGQSLTTTQTNGLLQSALCSIYNALQPASNGTTSGGALSDHLNVSSNTNINSLFNTIVEGCPINPTTVTSTNTTTTTSQTGAGTPASTGSLNSSASKLINYNNSNSSSSSYSNQNYPYENNQSSTTTGTAAEPSNRGWVVVQQ